MTTRSNGIPILAIVCAVYFAAGATVGFFLPLWTIPLFCGGLLTILSILLHVRS